MSTPEQHAAFVAGFMDDYFAEADEHLVAVQRGLLRLESALGGELPTPVIDELFRSFHSLKGISAMVELREAELLAHHMESCLRAIRQREFHVTAATFETLVDGANLLEQVIAARRAGDSPPPIARGLASLAALDPAGSGRTPPSVPPAARASGPLQPAPDARTWKVTFVPSPTLIARGIKVDAIRTRLLQIGQILRVSPRVSTGGGIAFEFDVQTDAEHQLAAWCDDGLTYEPLLAAATRSSPGADVSASREPEYPSSAVPRPSDVAVPATTNFVRVDLARLDDLMRLVGDLVVSRARLEATLQQVEHSLPAGQWRALQENAAGIERQLRELREGVMRVRLVPVGEIFRRMPFVVRDLARDSGKRIRLDLAGQSTEIDKFLVERMMDPVLHLVRNAISHGIETPDERIADGKAPEGTIRLSAATAGESVVIQISDDGRGIDVPAVKERARASGVELDGAGEARQLLDIICAPGFSTRAQADRASGRGVGMAVARTTIQELGGTLAVETEPGQGTTFTVALPLTLAITEAIIVHVGAHTFAVPQSAVREVIDVDTTAIRTIEHNELMPHRGGTLPVVRLARIFALPVEARRRSHAIVVGTGLSAVGLLVDRIAGQREVVVKSIMDPLIRIDGVSGATELGDGRLVLILDVVSLSRALGNRRPGGRGGLA